MNKAFDAVSTLLVMSVGFGLVAFAANSAGAAEDRYAAVATRSSIALVFDRIDPDPDAIGGVTSGDVTTTAVGEASRSGRPVRGKGARLVSNRNSSASRHAFRNWRHRVATTSEQGSEAVVSPQRNIPVQATPAIATVPSGKPEYRRSVSLPLPVAPAASRKPERAAVPELKPVPVKVHKAAPKPARAPVKVAAVAPGAVRVSTTNSGTVLLASSNQVALVAQTPQSLQPVRNNPEVREAMVTRGSTTQGRVNIMRVLTGKSLIIDLTSDAKRVSVADPDVAEVLVITSRQVMVNGLSDGETTIIIWDKRGNYTMYSLVVGDTLADQVMLEVTVAEINRSAMERHGMDVRQFGGQFGSVTQFGGVAPLGGQHPPDKGDQLFPVSLDGGISWAVVDMTNDIAVLFKQMQDENLGRILAEPKLLARSGKEASFLSGGEIPIVVTTNQDTSIEFKEFGTKVEFTPTVREDGTIDLVFKAEVSEPDFTSGVELFGFRVPAFITRRTETEVTLASGESLIVAGLMKEVKQELESKMPFVGDIPILGYMFRRTSYTNDVLELVVVVRPRLVRPIEAGRRVALPTDRGPLTRSEVRTGWEEEKVSRPRPF